MSLLLSLSSFLKDSVGLLLAFAFRKLQAYLSGGAFQDESDEEFMDPEDGDGSEQETGQESLDEEITGDELV